MVARQHPQVLASDEVVSADGTGEIAPIGCVVRIRLRRRSPAIFRNWEFGFGFGFAWGRLSDRGDILLRA